MNDAIRAGIIQVLTNIVSLVVLFGLFHPSIEQLAAINSFINITVGFLFLVFKQGQQASGTSTAVGVEVTTTPKKGT